MTIIRVIDLETTGMEPPAQVCEVATVDYEVESGLIDAPVSALFSVDAMPPEARAVHHISMDMLAGKPKFESVDMAGAYCFAAHNAKFEAQWIGEVRICAYKAALRIWPDAPSHGNMALRYWLEDAGKLPKLDIQMAHRAGPDALVTAHILKALFAAGATGKDMFAWTKEPALLPRCPIGKFRGKLWTEVDSGFLDWMGKQKDMEADLKWNAAQELIRRLA